MRQTNLLRTVAFVALSAFTAGAVFAQSSDFVNLTVTGTGSNEAEARLDAIRQATQQVASQLVIADRRVADDQILYDNVMSTMNGFVHNFKELKIERANGEVRIEAEIAVSGNLMRDFATAQAATISVDGGGMFGELLRSEAQGEVHQKMFESIWRRKTDGINANISLKDFDQDYVTFDATLEWSDDFVTSLKQFFSQVAYASCSLQEFGVYPIEDFIRAVEDGNCELKGVTKEGAIKQINESESLAASAEYQVGFYNACYYGKNQTIDCLIMDYLTILPLVSSEIPNYLTEYDGVKYDPQGIEVFQVTEWDGQPTGLMPISSGIDPFSLDLDLLLRDGNGVTLKKLRVSIPIKYILGVSYGNPSSLWDKTFVLSDASFQIKVPTSLIPLKDVKSATIAAVRDE